MDFGISDGLSMRRQGLNSTASLHTAAVSFGGGAFAFGLAFFDGAPVDGGRPLYSTTPCSDFPNRESVNRLFNFETFISRESCLCAARRTWTETASESIRPNSDPLRGRVRVLSRWEIELYH